MRIIGGEFRSRKLFTPRDDSVTRPLPDRAKESLFGLLRGHCEGASVFDAFAGTGSFGLEALSRGAERCVFVERDKDAADLLRRNIELLNVGDRADVVVGDALGPGALSRCPRPATLVFLDPPYALVRDPVGWKRVRAQAEHLISLLSDDGFLILRTPAPFSIHVRKDHPEEGAKPFDGRGRGARARRKPPREEDDRRGRRGTRWHEETVYDIDREGPATKGQIDDLVARDDDQEPASPERDVEYIKPDLAFPNAEGPETHTYHTTAVHMYMRRKPPAS
jgi:16S rRNA (guanine(966)-N(2))-methyltransferase RsmD